MPEGHTIHRLAAELNRRFGGRAVRVLSPQGRFESGAQLLDGTDFGRAEADGKHLLVSFGPGRWLHVHLGLFGRVAFGVFGPEAAARLRAADRRPYAGRDISYLSGLGPGAGLGGDDPGEQDEDGDAAVVDPGEVGSDVPPAPRGAVRLRLIGQGDYMDLRGPTACEILDRGERRALLDRLGPDPLRRDGAGAEFVRRVRHRRVDIGALLMDQSVVAGIGNVYRAELLFRHGVSPFRPGRDTDEATLTAMWDDLRVLMRAGVRTGRIVTTWPGDRDRPARRPVPREDAHYVYRRAGLPCRRCGTEVLTRVVVGRNLFWCPYCQAR